MIPSIDLNELQLDFDQFDDLAFEAQGGLKEFKFIPVRAVASIPDTDFETNTVTAAPTLETDGQWFSGYFAEHSGGYGETKKEPGGDVWFDCKMVGFYPAASADTMNPMLQNMNDRYILDITDKQGNRRLVGTLQEPLDMAYEFMTRTSNAERKGVAFVFSGGLCSPAPFYAP